MPGQPKKRRGEPLLRTLPGSRVFERGFFPRRWFSETLAHRCRLVTLCLGCLLWVATAWAQPQDDANAFGVPITVVPPRDRLRAMYEAATLAEREQYPAAARALQTVLESPEDYFLEHDLQTTLKQRAQALLVSWPQAGREAYERQYSAVAADLRERAERTGSFADWSTLLSQYWMTPAGRAAAEQWAAQSIDLGQPLLAGLYWSELRETHGVRDDDIPSGLREAVAWELAGRADLRRARLALFGAAVAGPIELGGRVFAGAEALANATAWLGDHQPQPGEERGRQTVRDWPTARGHTTRNAVAWPAGPIGVPAWTQSLLDEACDPIIGTPDLHRRAIVRQSLVDLEDRLITEDRLTWPAAVPVIRNNTVVVRTLAGLAAFDLKSGAVKWRSSLDESLFRKRWNALPTEAAAGKSNPTSDIALQQLLRERVYRDSVQGTLACDDRMVYAIESNLEPPPMPVQRNVIRQVADVPEPVNRLVAFDLEGGQLLWELGGPRGDAALPLAGHFFLGPPLVHNEYLYCLAESDDELRLLQLRIDEATRVATLEWSQVLVAPDVAVSATKLRRVAGLTPAWADGLLVCPTGCGILVAYDPLRRQLVWGFKYDSLEPRPFNPRTMFMAQQRGGGRVTVPLRADEEQSRWIDAVPVYAQGFVLFTPRDSSELHCLDAVTGEVRWKRPRGPSLSIAGVQDGRVVLVGRSNVESLRLVDGEPAWSTPIPQPVGQGLLLAQRYLLPVIDNEVLTLDLTTGQILLHSQFDPVLGTGNLVAAEGSLIAASPRGLSKFTALNELEADLNQRLAVNASDPEALAIRGELRLHRGDQATGLEDLRHSLRQRPDPRTASLLANTLVDGLRTDFARFRERAEEIDRLVVSSATRRLFLRTYARGLALAGEHEAALGEYLKLTELPDFDEQLERVSGGWTVRGDRIVQGQVRALYQSASPAERLRLDAALAQFAAQNVPAEQAAIRDRRLLRCFDGMAMLDQVRRNVLTHDDAMNPSALALLAARQLAESPQEAAAATGAAWLVHALINQQRYSEARPYLERLDTEWKSERFVAIGENEPQTGAQAAAHLRKEWLDPLSEGGWGTSEIAVERKTRGAEYDRITPVEVVGTRPPAWHDWTFEYIERGPQTFSARDPYGRVRWKITIPPMNDRLDPRMGTSSPIHFLHITGDRMILTLSGRLVALDLSTGAAPVVRWQYDLTNKAEGNPNQPILGFRADFVPCGRRRFLPTNIYDATDYTPTGQVLGLSEECVCYVQGGRLVVADIETGRILWTRLGVPLEVEGTATAAAITLFDLARRQAVVYRADDGEELARREVSDPNTWLWFHGERLLTVVVQADESITVRLQNLATDTVLWERPSLPAGTRFCTNDGEHVFQWSPAGSITKLRLSDGEPEWQARVAADPEADFFWIDRYADTEIVFIGNAITNLSAANNPKKFKVRIGPFDANHIGFQGHVLGIKSGMGAVQWTENIEPTAIDLASRPNLPLLAMAARQVEPPQVVNGQFITPSRFVATVLDKRSGDMLYKTTETVIPQHYQFELDSLLPMATLNVSGWMVEFRKDAE